MAGFLAVTAGAAQAVPAKYTLQGFTFADGTAITGNFVYDVAVTGSASRFSNINIMTTGAFARAGQYTTNVANTHAFRRAANGGIVNLLLGFA